MHYTQFGKNISILDCNFHVLKAIFLYSFNSGKLFLKNLYPFYTYECHCECSTPWPELVCEKNLTPATSFSWLYWEERGQHNFIIPCINNKPSHREENTLNTLNHIYNNKIHISCFSETLKSSIRQSSQFIELEPFHTWPSAVCQI